MSKKTEKSYIAGNPDSKPKKEIRFITSKYEELFRIPDGGRIMIDYPDCHFSAECRYLDDYHLTVNGACYHICQFAEMMEKNGGSCRPIPEAAPDRAPGKETSSIIGKLNEMKESNRPELRIPASKREEEVL